VTGSAQGRGNGGESAGHGLDQGAAHALPPAVRSDLDGTQARRPVTRVHVDVVGVTNFASAVPAYVLLAALAVIVALLTVVAVVTRAVVAKARPEDYSTSSRAQGRSWPRSPCSSSGGRGTRGPTVTPPLPVPPERRGGRRRGRSRWSGRRRLTGGRGLVGRLVQLLLAAPLLIC